MTRKVPEVSRLISKKMISAAISTRLTLVEIAKIESAAKAAGVSRGTWMRQTIVSELAQSQETAIVPNVPLLEELQGLKLLILNLACYIPTLPPPVVKQMQHIVESLQKQEANKVLSRELS